MSSMCPSIVIDKNGDAIFIVGSAGGSQITTTVAYVRHEEISIFIKIATNPIFILSLLMKFYKLGFCSTCLDE